MAEHAREIILRTRHASDRPNQNWEDCSIEILEAPHWQGPYMVREILSVHSRPAKQFQPMPSDLEDLKMRNFSNPCQTPDGTKCGLVRSLSASRAVKMSDLSSKKTQKSDWQMSRQQDTPKQRKLGP